MAREATWLEGRGDHVVLDFVNTVSWRHDPARFVERLDGPAAVEAWTVARGLPQVAGTTPAGVRALRELREVVHTLVCARAAEAAAPAGHGDEAGDEALRGARVALERAARAAVGRARLDLGDGRARWAVAVTDARSLRDHLALAAVDLLATARPERLHRCAEHDCGWVFLDTTRSGTRRFCDPAGCGNRARARRHHQRHRSASTT